MLHLRYTGDGAPRAQDNGQKPGSQEEKDNLDAGCEQEGDVIRSQVQPTAAAVLAQLTEEQHDEKVQETNTDQEDGGFEQEPN